MDGTEPMTSGPGRAGGTEGESGGGLPPITSVAVERGDALATTLARVGAGEIVVLERLGAEIGAVVPRELALLLAEIAAEEDGCDAVAHEQAAPPARPDPELRGAALAVGDAPVEVTFTDLDASEDDWVA